MNSFIKFIGLVLLFGCAGQSAVFASAQALFPYSGVFGERSISPDSGVLDAQALSTDGYVFDAPSLSPDIADHTYSSASDQVERVATDGASKSERAVLDYSAVFGAPPPSPDDGMLGATLHTKFTPEEDARLIALVGMYTAQNEALNWCEIAARIPGRNYRQCYRRWRYYLSPDICTSEWTETENAILMEKYKEFGPKWAKIAKFLPGRTDKSVRRQWEQLQPQKLQKLQELQKLQIQKLQESRKTVLRQGSYTEEEEVRLAEAVRLYGNHWKIIERHMQVNASHLPERSAESYKHHWLHFHPNAH
ncbi:MAG: hypothetical protein LBF84_02190 [Holosporales bacterium]|nr:hypothetical protein [Holosporales bacterium]